MLASYVYMTYIYDHQCLYHQFMLYLQIDLSSVARQQASVKSVQTDFSGSSSTSDVTEKTQVINAGSHWIRSSTWSHVFISAPALVNLFCTVLQRLLLVIKILLQIFCLQSVWPCSYAYNKQLYLQFNLISGMSQNRVGKRNK